MKVPEPLSPAARRLLELGSVVELPTAEQCERMDRALAPLFGAGRTAPLADSPRRASGERFVARDEPIFPRAELRVMQRSLQRRLALGGTKLALAFGALAATAGASFWLGRVWTPSPEPGATVGTFQPPDPVSLSRSHAVAADIGAFRARAPDTPGRPALGAGSQIVVDGAIDTQVAGTEGASQAGEASESSARAAAPSGRRRDGLAKVHPATGLAAEIERMARVEAALRQGMPARALEYLEQGRTEHLVEQAAALRAVARCEGGFDSSALAAADVLRRWPASPFESRIRDACGL
jgi:hypothetical protein